MKALAEIKNPSRHLHRIKLVCLFTTFVFSSSNSFHSPPHPRPPTPNFAMRKIKITPLKETNLGVAKVLFDL